MRVRRQDGEPKVSIANQLTSALVYPPKLIEPIWDLLTIARSKRSTHSSRALTAVERSQQSSGFTAGDRSQQAIAHSRRSLTAGDRLHSRRSASQQAIGFTIAQKSSFFEVVRFKRARSIDFRVGCPPSSFEVKLPEKDPKAIMPYSSNLTDSEWEILEPLLHQILPVKKPTRPPSWTKREILDGIFYQLKNGCNWEDLPKDLPPYSTVYWYYKLLKLRRSAWRIDESLTFSSTRTSQKKPKWTTLIIIDSQAVKNTCNASIASKGFCLYKSTNGIKRHLAVDTLGFPFFTHCTKANVSDDAG